MAETIAAERRKLTEAEFGAVAARTTRTYAGWRRLS